MAKPLTDIGASVRTRLINIERERVQDFQLLLIRYALERLLYRLSISQYRDRFILKGALLLTTWFDVPHRPTRDLDLLGHGEATAEAIRQVWLEVLSIAADDGMEFDVEGLQVGPIREDMKYGGFRMRTKATLAVARIPITVDVGFGDATEPGPEEIDLPVLLEFPAPHLRAYPRESVVAEKYHAMVELGLVNSRMKDFYDVWLLGRTQAFDLDRLARAIAATFRRRGTEFPAGIPDAFTPAFYENSSKQKQWAAFIRDLEVGAPALAVVVPEVAAFLTPFFDAVRKVLAEK
jgi:predicted nucleotidyltransferase component of viral defense system